MKFACINRTDDNSKRIESNLVSKLTDLGFKMDKENPDIVFSIGGDGTFLKTVNKYLDKDIIFININTGSFGYLCEFDVDEIPLLINNINSYPIKEVSLLELNLKNDLSEDSIDPNFMIDETLYAVNEFRIHSRHGKTLAFNVYINDTFLESLRGDGIIVSTSIGSSGIARSQGGALVDNEIEMLQIVEEGPILNCKYGSLHSSFVLNKDKHIMLKNFNYPFHIFYDSSFLDCDNVKVSLDISLSSKKIKILKNPYKNYIEKTSKLFTK